MGNLSLGGTGKTPMVELLLRHYQADKSVRTAVLSRGYGRISQGLVLGNSLSTVEDLGDEPYQIAQSFPETTLVVSASFSELTSDWQENTKKLRKKPSSSRLEWCKRDNFMIIIG